jgi:hypothetical protein
MGVLISTCKCPHSEATIALKTRPNFAMGGHDYYEAFKGILSESIHMR